MVTLLQGRTGIKKSGNFIAKWSWHYKVEQLLLRRPLHRRDTRINGDPSLLIGPTRFESGVE